MLAKLVRPILELHGGIDEKNPLYTRTLNGQCIIQRKPRRTTALQQAMRKAFGQKYAGRHPPKA